MENKTGSGFAFQVHWKLIMVLFCAKAKTLSLNQIKSQSHLCRLSEMKTKWGFGFRYFLKNIIDFGLICQTNAKKMFRFFQNKIKNEFAFDLIFPNQKQRQTR